MHVRHGDLLISKVDRIPAEAEKAESNVLAYGEATGHAHRLTGGKVFVLDSDTYLMVEDVGAITHEEHSTVELPPGVYKVTRQREYDPYEQTIRQVAD